MNEVKAAGNENSLSSDVELVKALIGKTVDNGTAIGELGTVVRDRLNEISEQLNVVRVLREDLKKLPNPTEHVIALDFSIHTLKNVQDWMVKKLKELEAVLKERAGLETNLLKSHGELGAKIDEHAQLFEKPLQKSIHHTHFLGKPLIVLGVFVLIIGGLSIFWGKAWYKAHAYQENDIKWRCIASTKDTLILHALQRIESDYAADADQFRKDVIAEEERLAALYNNWRVSEANKQEKEDLERKAKPLPGSRK